MRERDREKEGEKEREKEGEKERERERERERDGAIVVESRFVLTVIFPCWGKSTYLNWR